MKTMNKQRGEGGCSFPDKRDRGKGKCLLLLLSKIPKGGRTTNKSPKLIRFFAFRFEGKRKHTIHSFWLNSN